MTASSCTIESAAAACRSSSWVVEQVDLGLDRGVAQPAEGEHDAERGGAEQEHHARGRHDRGPQRGQRDGAEHLRRARRRAPPPPRPAAGRATPTRRRPRGSTTATLKNTRPATIATGGPVEAEEAERPGLPEQLPERHADDDGRQHERHQQRRPQRRRGPGSRSRCSTYAAGRPSSTASVVPAAADQTVNQTTRCTRGRPSTSSTAPGSKLPSGQKPSAIIPLTGARRRRRAPAPARGEPGEASEQLAGSSPPVTSLHSRQPLVAVLGDLGRVHDVRRLRLLGELRPLASAAEPSSTGKTYMLSGSAAWTSRAEQEVDQLPPHRRGWPRPRAPRRTPPAGSRCRAARWWSTSPSSSTVNAGEES